MVSPHFPPDTSAGTHRVRLIAPHLPAFGFEPTVLTVDPRDCEGRLDWDLEKLVPPELRVVRTRAWSTRWTRVMRVGDLGLRAYWGLRRAALDLLLGQNVPSRRKVKTRCGTRPARAARFLHSVSVR